MRSVGCALYCGRHVDYFTQTKVTQNKKNLEKDFALNLGLAYDISLIIVHDFQLHQG
jgi:hypothetical protein